jgi:hypothetical protein
VSLSSSDLLFYEPVVLVEQCKLDEVLLWVAIQRPPKSDWPYGDFPLVELSEHECKELGIPESPRGCHYTTPELVRKRFSSIKEKRRRQFVEDQVAEASGVQKDYARWRELVTRATEPYAAQIYLELRRGRLQARGKLLPSDVCLGEFLDDEHTYGTPDPRLTNLAVQPIPSDAWSQLGIDWLSSAVTCPAGCYCDIKVPTDLLMSTFPPMRSATDEVVYAVGDALMIDLAASATGTSERLKRGPGRPSPFGNGAWNGFHVEVARLLLRGELPTKREAAISMMTDWFNRTCGQAPGRTAIGERLTPYYHLEIDADGNSDGN